MDRSPSVRLWILPPLVTLLVGWVTLFYPHGRDQGSYAYAGWRVLLGEVPYRDVFVFKPPGSVFMHTAATGLFGLDPVAIRLWDLGWTAATALVIARFVQVLGGSFQAGIWAGCLVPLLYFQVDYWNIAQTDGWMLLPAVAALLLLLQERPWHWALGGALAAVAILFKYTALAFGLPVLALLWLVPERRGLRLASFVAGCAGLLLLVTLWLWGTGAWPAFMDSQFDMVPNYVSGRRKNSTLWATLELFVKLRSHQLDVAPMVGLALLGSLPAAVQLPRKAVPVLFASVVATAVMVVAQGKFYDYHYLPLLLPAAMSAGLLLDGLRTLLERWMPHFVAVGLVWLGLAAGLVAQPWRVYFNEARSVLVGERTRAQLWNRVGRYRYKDYNVGEIERAATWIRENTAVDDPIFTWTYEPELNVRAERRQVSRFLYNYPFRLAWEVSDYDAELKVALEATPPTLIVIGSKDARPGVTGTNLDSVGALRRNRVLGPLVRDHYCLVHTEGRYTMYRPCTK